MGIVPAARGPSSTSIRWTSRVVRVARAAALSMNRRPRSAVRPPVSWKGTMVALTWGSWPDRGGDPVRAAVVEQATPTGGEAPAGQEDGELGGPVRRCLGGELERGARQAPVGTLDDVEGQARQTEPTPVRFEVGRLQGVDGEVDGTQLVGGERPRRTGWPAPWPGPCGRRGRGRRDGAAPGLRRRWPRPASSCAVFARRTGGGAAGAQGPRGAG